jgi:hypothetical protein
MRFTWIATILLALCATSVTADTLYQSDVGGYSTGAGIAVGGVGVGVGVGVGLGAGTAYPYTGYQGSIASGYYSGSTLPYEGPNYPYGGQCCGCATCNNNCTSCQ